MQPWCLDCGGVERLCADHIIPIRERPDLAYVEENLAIRCIRCNGAKAGRPPAPAERAEVEARIAARTRRRVRLTTQGDRPSDQAVSSPVQAGTALHIDGRR